MRRLTACALVVLIGLIAASPSGTFATPEMVSVNIVDAPRPPPGWGYAPGQRRVVVGTWVTWSNDGLDTHTVTATDGAFDSGNLDPSQGFSWYFDQAGTFSYLCVLHPWMQGEVVVVEAGPGDQPSASSAQQSPGEDEPSDSTAQPDE
jgi:plastocyanin